MTDRLTDSLTDHATPSVTTGRIYPVLQCGLKQLEMWAYAQRDGRSAEYRWRLLFNAAKYG